MMNCTRYRFLVSSLFILQKRTIMSLNKAGLPVAVNNQQPLTIAPDWRRNGFRDPTTPLNQQSPDHFIMRKCVFSTSSQENNMPKKNGKKIRGVFERPKGSGIWWIRYADEFGQIHREKVGMRSR